MLRQYLLVAAALLGLCACNRTNPTSVSDDLSRYVEPRIGTAHCRWFHFAPGSMPYGMAKPGPSTNGHLGNASGWEATGYDYRDTIIDGFPNFHEFQVGGVSLMPSVGEVITVPTEGDTPGYSSAFSHESEVVKPGYYSVFLETPQVQAEVTATPRVAFQRFTFPESEQSNIIFDIARRWGESGPVVDAEVSVDTEGTVEGWVVTNPMYVQKYQNGADVRMYFSAVLDKKPNAYGTFNGPDMHPGADVAKGVGAGAYLTFDTKAGESITAKIGLSFTSVDNARLNRQAEAADLDFDTAREQSYAKWEDMLGRIRVEGDSIDKVKFYTGLYHALLGRGLASDVNGAYPRHDGQVGQLPEKDGKPAHNLYNTDAFWGGQWNLGQLWALAYPDYLSDYISSHLTVYRDGGWLADGVANSKYVSGVGTNLLTTGIAAAYQCGIRDFDIKEAYEACLKNELDGKDRPLGAGKIDTDLFVEYGYVPHKESGDGPDEAFMFSASHTLEYSYSAWAVARFAEALGDTANMVRLDSLANGWKRIYDASTNFMRPRLADGRFVDNFNPMQVWRGFQEGNAWQYTFYVPHDPKGLVETVGEDVFVERLDSIFTVSRDKIFSGGQEIGAFAGLQTLYNQGNQPCLHIPWLFAEAGRPDLSQLWVRRILDEFYGTDGIHGYGYGQDEDQGQLGAWYVISSLGLFDVAGLTAIDPSFAIGSPLFDKVTIKLDPKYYKGDKFEIVTSGEPGPYVVSKTLNGKPYDADRISFEDVVSGGTLDLTLSDKSPLAPKN